MGDTNMNIQAALAGYPRYLNGEGSGNLISAFMLLQHRDWGWAICDGTVQTDVNTRCRYSMVKHRSDLPLSSFSLDQVAGKSPTNLVFDAGLSCNVGFSSCVAVHSIGAWWARWSIFFMKYIDFY